MPGTIIIIFSFIGFLYWTFGGQRRACRILQRLCRTITKYNTIVTRKACCCNTIKITISISISVLLYQKYSSSHEGNITTIIINRRALQTTSTSCLAVCPGASFKHARIEQPINRLDYTRKKKRDNFTERMQAR